MNIHPKTAGATVGAAVGTIIVNAISSIHGVHLPLDVQTAITGLFSAFGSWLVPATTYLEKAATTPTAWQDNAPLS
jgi:hypothetical protein